MTADELERRIHEAIDRRASEIVALGEDIRRHPELGFKEGRPAGLVEETLGRVGLSPKAGLALTGVRADAAGRAGNGPAFALLGELDGLVVTGHPDADRETGAAHACGQIMPVLHPYMGGARGTHHAADFEITDPALAYVAPAKALASMVVDLLGDGARGAREVLATARPPLTRARYFEIQRGSRRQEVFEA